MIPTRCPVGTYAPGNNTRCLRCPAGYACGDPAAAPAPCGYATYSPGGWQNCSYCAEGRLPSFDRSECVDCAAGFQCPFYDQEVQLPCTLGTYSEGGQAYCTSCPAGYACADRTAPPTDAELCAEGYFSEGGRDACVACPNGVACAGADTAATNPCDAGTYSPLGEMDCLKCPRGSYCPSPTSGEYPCDLGTYSLTNSTNCTVCPPGFACPDAATVVVCTEGFYSPGGLTQCLDCSPGYRCPNASSTPSPPGSECAAGTWCNPPSVVEYCPPGTLGNTTAGRSADHACAPCPPGYYCDGDVVDLVDPIAVEAYGGTVLATAKLCDRGGYCPERSAEPTLCDAGERPRSREALARPVSSQVRTSRTSARRRPRTACPARRATTARRTRRPTSTRPAPRATSAPSGPRPTGARPARRGPSATERGGTQIFNPTSMCAYLKG